MGRVLDANDEIGASLFEVNTAVAFLAFAETPADACILEVGLGGRLDATNIVERRWSPASPASASTIRRSSATGWSMWRARKGRDRQARRAARHPALSAGHRRRIGEIAHDVGAIWEPRGLHWDAIVRQDKLRYRDRQGELDLPLPRLPGKHQALNAALAVAMLRHQTRFDVPPRR
jgi:dihydrofolate synthase/folylpolyglutamate synthase